MVSRDDYASFEAPALHELHQGGQPCLAPNVDELRWDIARTIRRRC